ncbi:hypothetical protein ACSBR2_035077 [Camellia fascicularis]
MGALFLLKGLVTVAYLLLLLLGKVLLKCWMNSLRIVCDGDVQNMLTLAKSFGIDHINVLIQTRSDGLGVGCGLADSSNVSDCDNSEGLMYDMEDRADLLPLYCLHKSKMFLSAGLAYAAHPPDGLVVRNEKRLRVGHQLPGGIAMQLSRTTHLVTSIWNSINKLVRFKGDLLAATTKDGNQGLGLHFSKCYCPFFQFHHTVTIHIQQHMSHIGLINTSASCTFSNRQFPQSTPTVFLSTHHTFCLLHLEMNLRDQMKYVNVDQKIGLMCKLQECAYARTIKILKQCSPTVVGNFLKDLHPKHWANAYFRYRMVRCSLMQPSRSTIGFEKLVISPLLSWWMQLGVKSWSKW